MRRGGGVRKSEFCLLKLITNFAGSLYFTFSNQGSLSSGAFTSIV